MSQEGSRGFVRSPFPQGRDGKPLLWLLRRVGGEVRASEPQVLLDCHRLAMFASTIATSYGATSTGACLYEG